MNGRGSLKTLEANRVIPVLAAVLAVSAAVAAFDILLVREARRHRFETGTRLFESAMAASAADRHDEALEMFRSAYNHDPQNVEYHLAFAKALDTSGRRREGRAALENLLTRYPSHGPANAHMARLLARDGDWQTAAWYYHRALYGEWTGTQDLRALRFELAELLAANSAREQLVSEVVLLNAEPAEPAEARRLARFQLAAGEWRRAEESYRALLKSAPDDPGLLAGLARALFGAGRYVAAERQFRRAIEAGAADAAVKSELDLASSINQLDPTLRRLPPAEKHRRSHELAAMLLKELQKCAPAEPAVPDYERELAAHERTRRFLEAAEADLDLFERLWAARQKLCGRDAQLPDVLALLGGQLSAQAGR